MHNITDYILSKTDKLKIIPEPSPNAEKFTAFNDAGTEVEVSEFLYSFVKMIKPKTILETGTHVGVSSTYLGQALKDLNDGGKLHTFEIIDQHLQSAKQLWEQVGVTEQIIPHLMESLKYDASGLQFEMLFLDSEPQLRFDEFIKFWDNLTPGGFILIHDLHPTIGHHGQVYHNEYDWPYGDFRKKLGPYMKRFDVQTISFPTPRGFTLFQKTAPGFCATEYLRDNL